MPTIEATPFLSPIIPDRVTTRAEVESRATRDAVGDQSAREGWQKVIDHCLIEWGCGACDLDDEGVEPPTPETVRRAISLAQRIRDDGKLPPTSVVPDPNGGIVFERRAANTAEIIHLWDDGNIEYRCFEGTRLVRRHGL